MKLGQIASIRIANSIHENEFCIRRGIPLCDSRNVLELKSCSGRGAIIAFRDGLDFGARDDAGEEKRGNAKGPKGTSFHGRTVFKEGFP